MLRSVFVIGLLAVGFRYSLKGPFYTLLFYLWLGYFRPEEWVWNDFISPLNLSYVVAVWLLVGIVVSSERLAWGRGAAVLAAVLAWSLISTVMSPVSNLAWPEWVMFAKVLVICFVIVSLVTTEARLRLVLLTIGISLGFEGAKQGWAELVRNPGGVNINTSYLLGDNNGIAVGMLMLTAVLLALAATARWRVERWGARFFAFGTLYRALSTYSRGGFLACGVLGLVYLARARHRMQAIIGVAVVVFALSAVLPDAFWQRMDSIVAAGSGDAADSSAAGRLYFWDLALSMAGDYPATGVGHNSYAFLYDSYDLTDGAYGQARSVHSSWFGILAEWGYPGFVLYVSVIVGTLVLLVRARRLARRHPDAAALVAYASAMEAGLLVFVVGGTFIPFHYNEMLWHFIAISIAIGRLIHKRALEFPGAEAESMTAVEPAVPSRAAS